MKKSELIKKLNSVEGDFDIRFMVSEESLTSDWPINYLSYMGEPKKETIYFLSDEQIGNYDEAFEQVEFDAEEDMKDEEIEKLVSEMKKEEVIVIKID